MPARWPHYRARTWLRGILPMDLALRIPKGPKDCDNHSWYRADERIDNCHHCVGERPHVVRPLQIGSDEWRMLSEAAAAGSEVATEVLQRRVEETRLAADQVGREAAAVIASSDVRWRA